MTAIFLFGAIALQGAQRAKLVDAAKASPYVHRFADKSQIEIVAISDSKFKRSWKPDGTPITISSSRAHSASFAYLETGTLVLLRLKVSRTFDRRYWVPFIETKLGDSMANDESGDPRVFEPVRRITPPRGARKVSLPIWVATADYEPRATCTYKDLNRVSGTAFGERIEPNTRVSGLNARFSVEYPSDIADPRDDNRFAAFDQAGHRFAGIWYAHIDQAWFSALPPAKLPNPRSIVKIQLMSRPLWKVIFPNVVVKP